MSGCKKNKRLFLIIAAGWALLLGLLLSACTPSAQKEVVVYVSVDDEYSRPICELFTKQTGIVVKLVTDSEETKSTSLVNRLIAEAARPRADVFWSGDPVRAAFLKRKGLCVPYHPAGAQALAQEFSDKDGYFTGFAARLRVIIYNRNLVKPEELPQSVFDLVQPRFSSKVCIANPLFGTTSMQAAALFQQLGETKATAFFEGLTSNGVTMLSSNGEVRRRVAAGDFMVGLTDSDDVSVALKDGQPVGFVIPDQTNGGTVAIPCAATLLKGGPNPENGQRFIDFLVSEEVERRLAESDAAHLPVRLSVTPPALFKQGLTAIRTMPLNYDQLAQELERLNQGFLKEWADRSAVGRGKR